MSQSAGSGSRERAGRSKPGRALPRPNPETEHFWQGAREGRLVLQHCGACDRPWFPPQPFCPRCGSQDWELRDASGAARLVSYVIAHRDAPGFEAPYVIALVELAEGPRLLTNLTDVEADPSQLKVGMALTVSFEAVAEDVVLPLFTPTGGEVSVSASGRGRREALEPDVVPDPVRRRSQGTAIVGAAETTGLGEIADLTPLGLHLDAARNALADAGLAAGDVDGVACAGVSPVEVAFGLGITPTWLDGTMVGGSSFLLHVRHALAALEAGLATCVLITHGESGRSRVGGFPGARRSMLAESFEVPYGVAGAPTLFTLPALAWMDRYGITEEQLASVAVAQRDWASRNPRALHRELVSVDDVLSSPMVAWPFRRLMCCLVTDGGGALVLTTAERAAGLSQRAVQVIGSGESAETPMVSQMEDLTRSRAFEVSARRALGEAGVGVTDIDHLMAYDAFVHTPCYALEALGVVGAGQAPAFVAEGNTAPGGSLPMNTNGGGLSYTHTGMYGMFAIQESVRQLRGEAPAQVPGVEVSVAHGVGGMFGSAGTLVMATQRP